MGTTRLGTAGEVEVGQRRGQCIMCIYDGVIRGCHGEHGAVSEHVDLNASITFAHAMTTHCALAQYSQNVVGPTEEGWST